MHFNWPQANQSIRLRYFVAAFLQSEINRCSSCLSQNEQIICDVIICHSIQSIKNQLMHFAMKTSNKLIMLFLNCISYFWFETIYHTRFCWKISFVLRVRLGAGAFLNEKYTFLRVRLAAGAFSERKIHFFACEACRRRLFWLKNILFWRVRLAAGAFLS